MDFLCLFNEKHIATAFPPHFDRLRQFFSQPAAAVDKQSFLAWGGRGGVRAARGLWLRAGRGGVQALFAGRQVQWLEVQALIMCATRLSRLSRVQGSLAMLAAGIGLAVGLFGL